jgi:tetratricopeptide (TPR) repeat protein
VVLKTLEKRPEDRYQTAAELFQALSAIEDIDTGPLPLWPSNTLTFSAQTNVGPLASTGRSRRRNAIIGAIIGGVIAAVATVLVIAFTGGSTGPEAGPSSAVANSQKKRAPDDQIQAVQTLLASANVNAARDQLDRLADQYPTDARVHLLTGQAHFLKKDPEECLRSFREAVRLDKSMRENELMLRSIGAYLRWIKGPRYGWKLRREAMEFVERYLDAGAADMLTRFVNQWWERELVWRAIEFLIRKNAAQGVDYVHAYELVFRDEASCAKRKEYLQDVVKRRDPKFLPLLRKILATPRWRQKYSRTWVFNRCIRDEVKAAITVLEGLEGSARRASGKGASAMDARAPARPSP